MLGRSVDIDEEISENNIEYNDEKLFEQYRKRTHKLVDPMLNTDKYWIPALFKVDQDGKVEIVSEINNLPFYKYGTTLYPLIASVFEKMIPSFEWILNGANLRNSVLQVIVDIKTYQLLAKESICKEAYHKIGYHESEGIEAVGNYYFDKTENGLKTDIFELKT